MRLKGLWTAIARATAKADSILTTHATGAAAVGAGDNQDGGSGGKRTAPGTSGDGGGGGRRAKVDLSSPSSKSPRMKGNAKTVTGGAEGAGAGAAGAGTAGAAAAGKRDKGMTCTL